MLPALFPGLPGGVELLVILLVLLVLLGLPLFLLVVGGFGFWRLSREDDDTDETVEELRRRVDEMEAQLTDADVREAGGGEAGGAERDGTEPDGPSDRADAEPDHPTSEDREGTGERGG